MFHTPITVPGSDDAPAQPLQHDLALLAAGLDRRFVQAGSTLVTAIETIDRVIAALDGVTSALDEDMAGAAVASLQATARHLNTLPDAQAMRAADLDTVAGTTRALRTHILDMHQAVKVLRIYGTNIKIAASGDEHFVGFVDGMGERLGLGEGHLDGFLAKIKELSAGIGSVQQAERLLASEYSRIGAGIPQQLASDAVELHAHLGSLAQMAKQVTSIARDVQVRIGVVLGALQIGDITRQRLEHVVSVIEMLAARARRETADPAVEDAVRAYIHPLLSAQLIAAAGEFDREAAVLLGALRAMGPDTARLLSLIEPDEQEDGRTFLQNLEKGISEVERVTVQLCQAGERSGTMVDVIAATVEELTERLVGLRRVRLDVQDMATNTRLLCRRFGTVGKAVAVIATEIDVYAARLGDAMNGISLPIRELGIVSVSMRAAIDGSPKNIGHDLTAALETIREGCQRSERGVREGSDDARQFIQVLHDACADLDGEMGGAALMREIAVALSPSPNCIDAPDVVQDALRAFLPEIAALYTMASERVVHEQYLLPGMATAASAAPAAPADDDDLFDDALF